MKNSYYNLARHPLHNSILRQRILFSAFALALTLFLMSCAGDESATTSTGTTETQQTPKASPLTEFERDLQFIRNGQFTYVLVISRRDGKPLDKEDGAFLRTNASQVVDWVMTEGGKKAIGGTNFNFEEGNMELLKKRFVVEDYTGR